MQWDAADPEYSDRGDHPIIRHYTREGKPLGAFVSRSIFPPGLSPGGSHIGLWHIRAARDRIGAVVRPGQSSGNPEWIEVDLAGKLLGRWKLGTRPAGGWAYTESGNLLRARPGVRTKSPGTSTCSTAPRPRGRTRAGWRHRANRTAYIYY